MEIMWKIKGWTPTPEEKPCETIMKARTSIGLMIKVTWLRILHDYVEIEEVTGNGERI